MNHKRIVTPVTIVALVSLLLVACSQNPVGIFASLAREQKIVDERELSNELTVSSMAMADGKYFITAGLLYYRTIANEGDGSPSQWQIIASPGTENENYVATSVVSFGGQIYVSYSRQDGAVSGVYTLDPAATSPTLSAAPVFDSDDTNVKAVGELFVVNDSAETLLVAIRTDDAATTYELRYSDDGTSFSTVPGTAASGHPWIDAADDGAGQVALLSAVSLLTDADGVGAGADAAPPATAPGRTGTAAFTGMHFEAGDGLLWVADNSGILYSTNDFGATWARSSSAYRYEGDPDNDAVAFTDVASPSSSTSERVYAGTQQLGYYVLGASAAAEPTSPAVSGSNYREATLSDVAVNGFFVDPDPAGDFLFALTSGAGLWRAQITDEPVIWIQE